MTPPKSGKQCLSMATLQHLSGGNKKQIMMSTFHKI